MELQSIMDSVMCRSKGSPPEKEAVSVTVTHTHTLSFLHHGFHSCSDLRAPELVKESLSLNYRILEASFSIHTLAGVTDMHHHTPLSFLDGFRRV